MIDLDVLTAIGLFASILVTFLYFFIFPLGRKSNN